ncbi:hypothetical protein EDM57_04260 [Brevibacillus gelatini]|uniref:Uncharacterized protein n=1 Tax=Brevibacillus gelatini TaxID=1655277 RepID=A0A3M8B7T1_9BACL|nr:hypothetical protein EDM57_04260 [Brevibacillus gelatini]
MDRFQYIESSTLKVAKCACKEEMLEGDYAYQIDDYLICDNSECFKKLCINHFGAIYGRLNKEGNLD